MNLCDHNQETSFSSGYSDSYVKLAQHRIIIISENITDTMAVQLSALLLYFDNESNTAPIQMYIHSNGGAATGLANIYDVMQMISAPIRTVCLGKCYSAAAILLAAGTKGQRYALKNSSIMIHGIQAGFPIPGHDVISSKNYYEFLQSNNDNIMKILAAHTSQTLVKIKEDCKSDVWLTPKQALEYGIIDHIL
jgi:ATP-dependent Clp protease, protease subunit